MRLLRSLAAASVFAAVFTQPAKAQDGRQFKDAWFWGLKSGVIGYSSPDPVNGGGVAPFVGLDWMITRSSGGLYVSFDQTFVSTLGSFVDRDPNNVQFEHFVDVTNLRRFTIAGMIFPMQTPTVHPYLGVGMSFNQLSSAVMQGGAGSTSRYAAALDSVQAKRSAFTPQFMGGVQYRLPRFSVFAQTAITPTNSSFFLSRNGGPALSASLEGGIRYNFGSSIDRTR